jgi:hypothetical protein
VRVASSRPLPSLHARCPRSCASRQSLSRKCVAPCFACNAVAAPSQSQCSFGQILGFGLIARSGQARQPFCRASGHFQGLQQSSASSAVSGLVAKPKFLRGPLSSGSSRPASGSSVMGLVRFGYRALSGQVQVQPNMSVNRRRHGRPARPCGRQVPSWAARPGCPPASPRLPLR